MTPVHHKHDCMAHTLWDSILEYLLLLCGQNYDDSDQKHIPIACIVCVWTNVKNAQHIK